MRSPAAARVRRRRFQKDSVSLRAYLRAVSPDDTDADQRAREAREPFRAT